MTKKLVLVGGGGHARSCIGVIESQHEYSIYGLIDTKLSKGERVLEYPVLGGNELIPELAKQQDLYFLITVGQVKSAEVRVRLFELLESSNATVVPAIVAETAFVSPYSSLGKGTIVMQHVTLNAAAHVGQNVILNNHCLVEHDCRVGNHSHISTGAILNGHCEIGDRVFIGSGAVLTHGVTVASDVIIGAGSVVINSITEPGTYAGNPVKKIN
ncbi:MAG TPA: acetyltransferase [Chitinophagaceae bacterium]